MEKNCPEGHLQNIDLSKSKNEWICDACGSVCTADRSTDQNNPGTAYSEECYWSAGLCDVAPVALAISYHQLCEYAREGNVGCTLFLIRDVFELMIKIPVTILFNGIHGACRSGEGFLRLLKENTGIAKLYDYSMQMLSTGKWWECVRIAAGMEKAASEAFSAEEQAMYVDTIRYLKELHKLLFFRIPGKPKVSMVTWRNRTLGHSCLADNPVETYQEIPYILKMLKTVGDISVNYYQRICLTDADRKPLRGLAVDQTKPEVYIQYADPVSNGNVFSRIHRFIAGRDRNLSCFDGYEKGKAYLLNYKNGERYRDFDLSRWLTSHQNIQRESVVALSGESVFADNLESRDMVRLEERLMQREEVTGVSFLGRWLMDAVDSCGGGMLLLTAERGLGKSTFCGSVDPLDHVDVVYGDDAYRETLQEFLDDTAVRVWHFNSEYRSRKDIFVPGLRDALLTLSPEDGNRICGRLESQYNNLTTCSDDLCGLYFAECLNRTMEEYRTRTDQQKLLLILDGIDEVPDAQKLISFLPDPAKLDDGIYILLTSRTKQEVAENAPLVSLLENGAFQSTLCFTRDTVAVDQDLAGECVTDNAEYRRIIADYVGDILREQKVEPDMETVERLAAAFEYRFSSLAAYRKLCRLSPVFYHRTGADLFGVFLDQVESNAPDYYVNRLKRILNTLAWVGEPITLRELAYLSGERYISYRLLGMINDMQAFLRVTRSGRGNCYELSHPQWEQAVKDRIPHGDILFRRHCNELIAEMEAFFTEDNIALILESAYEGELWLLMHILDIYNRSWRDLKENWFEEIRIGSFEQIIKLFLKSREVIMRYFTAENPEKPLSLLRSYNTTVQTFSSDSTGNKGSKEEKLYTSNAIIEKIAGIYDCLSECGDHVAMARITGCMGDSYNTLAGSAGNDRDKKRYRENSLEAYKKHQRLLSRTQNPESCAVCLYKIGRAAHLLNKNGEALEAFLQFISIAESVPSASYDLHDYLCRAYIRSGLILEESKEEENAAVYFEKALDLSHDLVAKCESVSSLDTQIWIEGIMSRRCESHENWENAIIHRECALAAAERILQRSENRGAYEDRYRSLSKLSIYYEKRSRYWDSMVLAEKALEMETKGIQFFRDELLEVLVRVCGILGYQNKVNYYTSQIEEKRDSCKKSARAYTELLGFLKVIEQSYIDRIPAELMDFLKRYADKEYDFCFSVQQPVGSQLSKAALALLAYIGVNFWPELFGQSTQAKYADNEDRYRCNYWEKLRQMLAGVASQGYAEHDKLAFFEVYDILEHLPEDIVVTIPVEMLVWIKNGKKGAAYLHKPHEIEVSALSSNTLCLLKYVLEKTGIDIRPEGDSL